MKKIFFILLAINLLIISYQFKCSQFTDQFCGGHNRNHKLQCHKFTEGCYEVEIDDGCEINYESNTCNKKDTVPEGEICFNYGDTKKCKRIKDVCTSYKDLIVEER